LLSSSAFVLIALVTQITTVILLHLLSAPSPFYIDAWTKCPSCPTASDHTSLFHLIVVV
jgi:hypothetical protein